MNVGKMGEERRGDEKHRSQRGLGARPPLPSPAWCQ